ncbi:hypothetical protein SB822_00490 [Paraburkholderia sp. SIMBA_054]
MIGEVDRLVVRPDGKMRAPYEMTRIEWLSVVAVGLAAFGVYPCFSSAQLAQVKPNEDSGATAAADLREVCDQQMKRLWTHGHEGPAVDGREHNMRHELHVALALCTGKVVPANVYAEYRDGRARSFVDADAVFKLLVDLPAIRGRLSPSQLRKLVAATRSEVVLDESNIERFISAMVVVPPDASAVDVDDHLFRTGLLSHKPITRSQPEVDVSVLTTALAREIFDESCTAVYRRSVAKAQALRDKREISEREFQFRCRQADNLRNSYPTEPSLKLAAAFEARDAHHLLIILDTPDGTNEIAKKVFRKHFGVRLRGLTTARRRKATLAFCGLDAAARAAFEQQIRDSQQQRLEAEAARRAITQAEISDVETDAGTVSARVYVDSAVAQGYRQIVQKRQGRISWWLLNPDTQQAFPLRSTNGTLDYARDALHLPVLDPAGSA